MSSTGYKISGTNLEKFNEKRMSDMDQIYKEALYEKKNKVHSDIIPGELGIIRDTAGELGIIRDTGKPGPRQYPDQNLSELDKLDGGKRNKRSRRKSGRKSGRKSNCRR